MVMPDIYIYMVELVITGVDGVPGSLPEVIDDPRDLLHREPPGRRELLEVAVEARLRADPLLRARQRRRPAGL
jgi:hypothetical protein